MKTITMNKAQGNTNTLSVKDYRDHKAWSTFLEKGFGSWAALSFAFGSDFLLDEIEEDLNKLRIQPAGTHLGQVESSLAELLPEQFLTSYDYSFLWQMRSELINMQKRAGRGVSMQAHSVLEELLIYLCNGETVAYIESTDAGILYDHKGEVKNDDWLYDLFDDSDIITSLYSDIWLPEDNAYHFAHWREKKFYSQVNTQK